MADLGLFTLRHMPLRQQKSQNLSSQAGSYILIFIDTTKNKKKSNHLTPLPFPTSRPCTKVGYQFDG